MRLTRIYDLVTYLFDPLHFFWESDKTLKRVASLTVVVFLVSLVGIELKRRGLMPAPLAEITPSSHYNAVNVAFTLVLVIEVISLIFTLPCSFSRAMGKQLEILALIQLRSGFKELVHFPEPAVVPGNEQALSYIVAHGLGAFLIFVILGVYTKVQRNYPDMLTGDQRYRFVAGKKALALVLLAAFAVMGTRDMVSVVVHHDHGDFFASFYTMLIFSDILIVLISQRFLPMFHMVFRNSGFALCTLIMRLALTAPPYLSAAMGVGVAVFTVCLTLAHNYFYGPQRK